MVELSELSSNTAWLRFVFDAVWQSTFVGVVFWFLLTTVFRRPASRAWIALLGALLCAFVPVASLVARSAGYGLLSARAPVAKHDASTQNTRNAATRAVDSVTTEETPTRNRQSAPLSGMATIFNDDAAQIESLPLTDRDSNQTRRIRFTTFVVLCWAAASFVVAFRVLASGWKLRQLCRTSNTCSDPTILSAAAQAAERIGLKKTPDVRMTPVVGVPAVVAFGKSTLLIPDEARVSTRTDWLAVFCHELAHVRRRDGWALLAIELATTVLPWQPLSWILRRIYRQSAEEACDDWAVSTGSDPVDFAETLTVWSPSRSPKLLFGVLGDASEAKRRICRLLEKDFSPKPQIGFARLCCSAALAAGLAACLALLQVHEPAVIADDDSTSKVRVGGANAPGANDGILKIGEPPRLTHDSSLRDFAMSPDGKLIAYGTDSGVCIWDVQTGELVRTLENYQQRAAVVAISPDSKLLAFGNDQHGTVRLTDLRSGKELAEFNGLPGAKPSGWWRGSLAFSPSGTKLATGANDGHVRIFSVPSGKLLHDLEGHDQVVGSLCFSPDGATLVSGSHQTVRFWNPDRGEEIRTWDLGPQARLQSNAVAFSASGNFLAAATTDGLKLLHLQSETEVPLQVDAQQRQYGVAAVPSESTVITVSLGTESVVAAWDIVTGALVREYEGLPNRILKIAVTPDGKSIVTMSSMENRVRFWDIATGEERFAKTNGHAGAIHAIAFSKNDRLLATGGADRTVALWDTSTGTRQRVLSQNESEGWPRFIEFSPDAMTVAAGGGWDDRVRVWQTGTGKKIHELETGELALDARGLQLRRLQMILSALRYSPDGSTLYAVGSTTKGALRVRSWNLTTGNETLSNNWSNMASYLSEDADAQLIQAIDFSPSCEQLALAWSNGIHVLDTTTSERLKHLNGPGGRILSVRFSPDGRMLASWHYEHKTVIVWDVEKGEILKEITNAGPDHMWRVAFSPDGHRFGLLIAPPHEQASIRIWDVPSWDVAQERTIERKPSSLAFSSDHSRLAVGFADGAAEVWDLARLIAK